VVTKKVGKPATRARVREATAVRRSRGRSHSLAPPHLGEAASAAVLAVAVLGLAAILAFVGVVLIQLEPRGDLVLSIALAVAGLAMAVSGMTVAGRFGDSPPPNVDQLGLGQVLGGIGLGFLGLVLSGSGLAVLADVPRSRPVAAAASGLAAILAFVGVVLIQLEPRGDLVLSIALAVAGLIFAIAAVILVRPRS
jgi:hypothetical protein